MAYPFKCDEKVTIERRVVGTDPDYGTQIESWEVMFDRYWANVQDVLPIRAEETSNGIRTEARPARLRMRGVGAATGEMRVILHNRGDQIMQITAGPAMLDDRAHYEFKIEAYSHG